MRSLRISLTNRCNFNCFYCKPLGGRTPSNSSNCSLLSYPEIIELTKIFGALGVKNVRLTGGEPLVRQGVPELVRQLKLIKTIDEVTLTTNGYFLEQQLDELQKAGLDRINMSLDSFRPERFRQLTGQKNFSRVIHGLNRLLAEPRLYPVKLNTVAIRGFNGDEIMDFADWAADNSQTVRFIEFMPLEKGLSWKKSELLLNAEIKQNIAKKYRLTTLPGDTHETAQEYSLDNSGGKLGFISSISHPFCNSCDRIRLTSDGKLKACLFSYDEADLLPLIRPDFDKNRVRKMIRKNFQERWEGGCEKLRQGDYELHRQSRTMSNIGG